MFRRLAMAIFAVLVLNAAKAQDPQTVVNSLIQREIQKNRMSHENGLMRLQLERLELQQQLKFREESDDQIMEDLARYCPTGKLPCRQRPPLSLIQEAERRSLIEFNSTQPNSPAFECITAWDPQVGGMTRCY